MFQVTSHNGPDTLELEEVDVLEATIEESQLIVYNDDHNTFDWVIECLVEVVGHTSTQAEQNAMIIHYKGKAAVKSASLEVLRPYKDSLIERGLSAVIEGQPA